MELALIILTAFESLLLCLVIVVLMRIEKKIDTSEFWKEMLDAKVRSIVYKLKK